MRKPANAARSALVLAALVAASIFGTRAAALASAPPGTARISVIRGNVSIQRAISGDTVAATINAPLMVGDYLTTGSGARTEVQFGYGSMLRAGSNAQLRFTQIQSNANVAQLAAGTVEIRVLNGINAHPEVDTPTVAVRPLVAGAYRVTVDSAGNTEVTVRSGQASVATESNSQTIGPGNTMLVTGTASAPQIQFIQAVAYDNFDRWNQQRDRSIADANSYQYLNSGVVGAYDLGNYGRWVDVPGYGNVWSPNVGPGWGPYRNGQWVWENYYGWTWVSDEPWGWAPYHYGRWFYDTADGWCWDPGSMYLQPVWEPALVAFFGFGDGGGFGIGFGDIGWVPLAPGNPFYPWWGSDGEWNNVTIVNNITNITNVYGNVNAPGGVTGVSVPNWNAGQFQQTVSLLPNELRRAKVIHTVVPLAPTRRNLRYTNGTVAMTRLPKPAPGAFVGFRTHIQPAVRANFAQQQLAIHNVLQRTYPHGVTGRRPILAPPTRRPIIAGGSPPIVAGSARTAVAPLAPSNIWQRFNNATHAPTTAVRRPILAPSARRPVIARHGATMRQTSQPPSSVWQRFGTASAPRQYSQPHYAAPQYSQPHYSQPHYAAPRKYSQAHYSQPQYSQPHYSQPQYSQPQYSQPHYSQPHYSQPHYSQPHYSQPQYSQPHYSQPHYSQPRYSQPHYSQPHYSQPHYSAPHYSAPPRPAPAYVAPSRSSNPRVRH
ncbi:MAG: DUF6600 domain-containing protein [Vulcanimicrobiaceae bacterium]